MHIERTKSVQELFVIVTKRLRSMEFPWTTLLGTFLASVIAKERNTLHDIFDHKAFTFERQLSFCLSCTDKCKSYGPSKFL